MKAFDHFKNWRTYVSQKTTFAAYGWNMDYSTSGRFIGLFDNTLNGFGGWFDNNPLIFRG